MMYRFGPLSVRPDRNGARKHRRAAWTCPAIMIAMISTGCASSSPIAGCEQGVDVRPGHGLATPNAMLHALADEAGGDPRLSPGDPAYARHDDRYGAAFSDWEPSERVSAVIRWRDVQWTSRGRFHDRSRFETRIDRRIGGRFYGR